MKLQLMILFSFQDEGIESFPAVKVYPQYNKKGLLYGGAMIETDLDKRAFLFVDSVTLSGDWIGQ